MAAVVRQSPKSSDLLQAECRAAKRNFLGIGLSVISRARLLELFGEAMRTSSRLTISFLNPSIAVHAHRHPEVAEFMNAFDVVLPDGIGVVCGARFLGLAVPERLGNDDVGPDIWEVCREKRYSNFLFGSAPGVAERAAVNLECFFPNLRIAGTLHGFWFDASSSAASWCRPEDSNAILEKLNARHPDVLWVGLATPLQQRWVFENRHRIEANVVITCGGYLDHLAERVQWYPRLIYRLNLLWLYRLVREPRRLWRRYSIEIAVFARLLLRSRAAAKADK